MTLRIKGKKAELYDLVTLYPTITNCDAVGDQLEVKMVGCQDELISLSIELTNPIAQSIIEVWGTGLTPQKSGIPIVFKSTSNGIIARRPNHIQKGGSI